MLKEADAADALARHPQVRVNLSLSDSMANLLGDDMEAGLRQEGSETGRLVRVLPDYASIIDACR